MPPDEKTIHFSFPQPKVSGRIVAEFNNVAKSYGAKHVFAGVNFTIERGDRIALVGVNGAGKSTLIKLLAGTEPLSSGEYKLGHNVEADYFAQDQYKELNTEARMIDDLSGATARATQTELRSLLGCFLFSEDDVFKKIGVLSGGERNRYALARILLQPSNFLLLDEPTNHLDMRAKDVLLEAMQGYTGTAVFVSHDRYFIDKLATRIFEVGEGGVHIFPGNYEDYLWRKGGSHVDLSLSSAVPPAVEAHAAQNGSAPPLNVKRLNPMKVKQLKSRTEEIEQQLGRLEANIADSERELGNFKNADETQRLSDQMAADRASADKLMAEWEDLSATIEANA